MSTKTPIKTIMVTDLNSYLTYILEPVRRGSRKLNASCMTARGRDADVKIEYRRVPLFIRRAAKAAGL